MRYVTAHDPRDFRVYTGNVKASARTHRRSAPRRLRTPRPSQPRSVSRATAGAGTSSPQSDDRAADDYHTQPPPTEPAGSTSAAAADRGLRRSRFGVTVGGVRVGGLMPYQASKAVTKAYARAAQLVVVDEARTIELAPDAARREGRTSPKAIRRARARAPRRDRSARRRASRRRRVRRVCGSPRDTGSTARRATRAIVPRRREAAARSSRRKGVASSGSRPADPIRTALATNSALADPAAVRHHEAEGRGRPKLDEAIVIMRGSNRLLFFDDAQVRPQRSGVATGQSAYPTPLGDYEIVNHSSGTRGGTRRPSPWAKDSQPVPPGPRQPARDALDGSLRAIRRHPRHAGRRVDRLLGLARLHPHADSRRRVALPAREGRHAGLHHRPVVAMALAPRLVAQGVAIGLVALLFILLAWSLLHDEGGDLVEEARTRASVPSAPDFTLERLDEDGESHAVVARAGRPVVLNVWASWCIPCKDEAPYLEQVWRANRAPRSSSSSASTRRTSARTRAASPSATTFTLPARLRRAGRRDRRLRRDAASRDVRHRPRRARGACVRRGGERGRGARPACAQRSRRALSSMRARVVTRGARALLARRRWPRRRATPKAADLEAELVCPVCETTLDQSNAPIAQRMKACHPRTHRRRATAKRRSRTRSSRQFGPAVIAEPPGGGFELLAWLAAARRRCAGGAVVVARPDSVVEPAAVRPRADERQPLDPAARAPRRRRARALRPMRELDVDPGRVPRGDGLVPRALRAPARPRATCRRSPAVDADRLGSRAPRAESSASSVPFVVGFTAFFVLLGVGAALRRAAGCSATSSCSSAIAGSSSSCSGSRSWACCRGRSDSSGPVSLQEARGRGSRVLPRRRVRRVRRAVHRARCWPRSSSSPALRTRRSRVPRSSPCTRSASPCPFVLAGGALHACDVGVPLAPRPLPRDPDRRRRDHGRARACSALLRALLRPARAT